MDWTLDRTLDCTFNWTPLIRREEVSIIFSFEYSIYKTIPCILSFKNTLEQFLTFIVFSRFTANFHPSMHLIF
jgi:hypothetical protein